MSGVTSMLVCPRCTAISRTPSLSMRVTLWTGVVVLRGMVIREWLQGRELNPRRQGYESRLGTGLPAVG